MLNSVENVMGYHFKRIGLMLILFFLRLANIARVRATVEDNTPNLSAWLACSPRGLARQGGEIGSVERPFSWGFPLGSPPRRPSVEHVQSLDWYNVLHQRQK